MLDDIQAAKRKGSILSQGYTHEWNFDFMTLTLYGDLEETSDQMNESCTIIGISEFCLPCFTSVSSLSSSHWNMSGMLLIFLVESGVENSV